MKNITLLGSIILLYILITSPVYSQTNNTQKDADYFLGTWSGMIGRIGNDSLKIDYSIFMWRIHKVDIAKDQIEMTEIYYKANVFDTATTEKPRMIYPAKIEDKSLHIQLTDKNADTTFTLKLSPISIEGQHNLQNERGKLRLKDKEVNYMLRRIDSDTTNLPPKDQRKVVTVIVQPPPPVEPKKN